MNIVYKINYATQDDILSHFSKCDNEFLKELIHKVDIEEYVKKIIKNAKKVESWLDDDLIGLVAVYENFEDSFAFITNVSVDIKNKRKGIASKLLTKSIESAKKNNLSVVKIEVNVDNIAASSIYKKFGFEIYDVKDSSIFMKLLLN